MGKTITNGELSSLTMELSMLLHAGIGVGDALASITIRLHKVKRPV